MSLLLLTKENTNMNSIIQIAQIAYAALSVYEAIRKGIKQKNWDDLGEEAKKAFIEFIKPIVEKPYIQPEYIHSNWMDNLLENGWKWGKNKDEKAKTHPSLISWLKLPIETQFKNILVQNTVQQLVALSQAKRLDYINAKFKENPDWQNTEEAQKLQREMNSLPDVPLGIPYDSYLSGYLNR